MNIVDFVKTTASVSGLRIGETPTSSAGPGQYVPRTVARRIGVFDKSARRQGSVNYTGYTPPSPGPWSWWSSLVVGGGAGVRAHAGELSGSTAACLLPPRRRFKGCWCREAAVASHSGRCRVSMEGRCKRTLCAALCVSKAGKARARQLSSSAKAEYTLRIIAASVDQLAIAASVDESAQLDAALSPPLSPPLHPAPASACGIPPLHSLSVTGESYRRCCLSGLSAAGRS